MKLITPITGGKTFWWRSFAIIDWLLPSYFTKQVRHKPTKTTWQQRMHLPNINNCFLFLTCTHYILDQLLDCGVSWMYESIKSTWTYKLISRQWLKYLEFSLNVFSLKNCMAFFFFLNGTIVFYVLTLTHATHTAHASPISEPLRNSATPSSVPMQRARMKGLLLPQRRVQRSLAEPIRGVNMRPRTGLRNHVRL